MLHVCARKEPTKHHFLRSGKYHDLSEELIVQVVDEYLLYARLGEVVRPVQGYELSTYALELRQSHRRRRKFDGLFDIWNRHFTAALARMIFLVSHDLVQDVRRCLVELVEVVLLGRRFLVAVSMG